MCRRPLIYEPLRLRCCGQLILISYHRLVWLQLPVLVVLPLLGRFPALLLGGSCGIIHAVVLVSEFKILPLIVLIIPHEGA
jgi:hypothetical protein